MAHFKHIVIGSGQAGVPLAIFLANRGESTLIIEKDKVGGTCVNTGCTPSKTMHEAIRKIYHSQHIEYAGLTVQSSTFDFGKLMKHVRDIRNTWSEGSTDNIENTENLTLARGRAHFIDDRTVSIRGFNLIDEQHTADFFYINTGARPRMPEVEGLNSVGPLTNRNIFELTEQPKSLIIIGGGYIGLEFAQMFARIGTSVSVVNHGDKIVGREDDDIIELLQKKLEEEGVTFYLNKSPEKAIKESNGVSLTLEGGKTLKADKILVAAGRIPNSDHLGLEAAGIKVNDKGVIEVNEVLGTSVEHIYALGEVAGTPQFTHMAYDDYRVVKANIEKPKVRNTLHRTVPYTLFTDPHLGRFGLNEKEAKKKNIDYKLYEMPMSSVARAAEKNEPYGKIKVLCDPQSEEILGASILGVDGGEMMTVLQMACSGGITAPHLQQYIFAHPLLAEGFNNLFTS
ncbi:dihydrolipoyl dehydrogenase family protein [Owenweeksia hongkongensis]|uniref:dihydrolipoyl dehydrogenase family protein n=1 Tax=Owenweeksia hongkongensis TaxID=253245 RepID=UPI003A8F1F64